MGIGIDYINQLIKDNPNFYKLPIDEQRLVSSIACQTIYTCNEVASVFISLNKDVYKVLEYYGLERR